MTKKVNRRPYDRREERRRVTRQIDTQTTEHAQARREEIQEANEWFGDVHPDNIDWGLVPGDYAYRSMGSIFGSSSDEDPNPERDDLVVDTIRGPRLFGELMEERYPAGLPGEELPTGWVLCDRHGHYWNEDGCDGCAAEEDERIRTLPEHVLAVMVEETCPNCGKQYWVEDGCGKCFPDFPE